MGMQDRVSQPKLHMHRPREGPTDTQWTCECRWTMRLTRDEICTPPLDTIENNGGVTKDPALKSLDDCERERCSWEPLMPSLHHRLPMTQISTWGC